MRKTSKKKSVRKTIKKKTNNKNAKCVKLFDNIKFYLNDIKRFLSAEDFLN